MVMSRSLRGGADGRFDALVAAAAAEIAGHRIHDVLVGRSGLRLEQGGGLHDLPGLAVAALRHAEIAPGDLHRCSPFGSRPSMVVTDLPPRSDIGTPQARTASPSICTVQAPHTATPQPNFVPVRPSSSRRYHISGIDVSPSNDRCWPFTFRLTMTSSLAPTHA